MKIHEYQAKEILKKYSVPTPKGKVVFSSAEAVTAAKELGVFPVVVKAQIHAGGRGKAGGVKLAQNLAEVESISKEILGKRLFTQQTGPEGKEVKKLLIEEGMGIAKELYLGIVIDRSSKSTTIIASEAGGMEIEEVAAHTPEKIIKEKIDPLLGIQSFQARNIAFALNLNKDLINEASKFIINLYNLFIGEDCSMAEINPLVITIDKRILALDAKMNFDDNAMFRHKANLELRDLSEEDPLEIEASKYKLNYIKLDGNIGCMVNGAGLAMATMDIIKLYGGEPANFLDVGGGANAEMVENAFRILLADKNVKGVLINIFGGILRCDVLAQGLVEAATKLHINIPLVVRLEGTNVEKGREILNNSSLKFMVAKNMQEAAEKVVEASK